MRNTLQDATAVLVGVSPISEEDLLYLTLALLALGLAVMVFERSQR